MPLNWIPILLRLIKFELELIKIIQIEDLRSYDEAMKLSRSPGEADRISCQPQAKALEVSLWGRLYGLNHQIIIKSCLKHYIKAILKHTKTYIKSIIYRLYRGFP